MEHAHSSNHISSSMNFWYLSGMGYGLHAVGGPVFGMSISNRLGLPTTVDDFITMESGLFC